LFAITLIGIMTITWFYFTLFLRAFVWDKLCVNFKICQNTFHLGSYEWKTTLICKFFDIGFFFFLKDFNLIFTHFARGYFTSSHYWFTCVKLTFLSAIIVNNSFLYFFVFALFNKNNDSWKSDQLSLNF
jgi:hypothetical protein